jgi:hypothetical protein
LDPVQPEHTSHISAISSSRRLMRGSPRQIETETPNLFDNSFYEQRQGGLHRRRAADSQFECTGNQPEQDEVSGVMTEPARAFQEIRHAYLVGGQPVFDSGHHLGALETNERTRRGVGPDSIHEDHDVLPLQIRKKGQTKRPAVQNLHFRRPEELLIEEVHGEGAQAIIAAQDIAEAKDE